MKNGFLNLEKPFLFPLAKENGKKNPGLYFCKEWREDHVETRFLSLIQRSLEVVDAFAGGPAMAVDTTQFVVDRLRG